MPLTADAGEPLLHTGTPGVTDVTFRQLRQLTQLVSEGVVGAGDLKVTAPGGMNVAVAAGYAFVAGTTITGPEGQHKYGVPLTAAKTLGTITAPVSSTRRDTVILRAYDEGDAPGSGGLNVGRVEYLVNASETLTAAALPANAIALAYVDVPVGAAAISSTMIREARKRARAAVDDTLERIKARCWAGGEGIAPLDQSCDCTIASMGTNRATDFDVTTGGSALTLSVAAGNAWVLDDTDLGLHFVRSTAAVTVATAAAHATNPRIDRVVLDKLGAVYTVTGTATGGATLANLTGAPALPADTIPLAYVLVPAAFAGPFVTATHVLDQRFFAYRPGRVIGRVSTTSNVGPTALAANGRLATLATLEAAGDGAHRVEVEGIASYLQSTGAALLALEVWDNVAVGTGVPVQSGTPGTNADAWAYSNTAVANGIAALTVPYRRASYSGRRTFRLAVFSSAATTVVAAAGTSIPIWLSARYI